MQTGGLSFVYTLWDWTASTSVALDTLDTFKAELTVEVENVVEGEMMELTITSSLTFESDQALTIKFSPSPQA